MVNVGQKIRQARKLKRITQDDLAQAIGVSDKSISAYESMRANPPLSVLEKISKATNRPLSYFIEENTEASVLAKLRDVEEELQEIRELLKKQK